MPRPGQLACWLLVCITAVGCADGLYVDYSAQPPVYVIGRVTYRGYPVAYGQIVFSADPDFNAGTDLLTASLGHDGSFLLHDGKHTGIKPGYYRITVSAHPQTHVALPRRYYDPSTSGLRCQVEPDQPLRLNILLE